MSNTRSIYDYSFQSLNHTSDFRLWIFEYSITSVLLNLHSWSVYLGGIFFISWSVTRGYYAFDFNMPAAVATFCIQCCQFTQMPMNLVFVCPAASPCLWKSQFFYGFLSNFNLWQNLEFQNQNFIRYTYDCQEYDFSILCFSYLNSEAIAFKFGAAKEHSSGCVKSFLFHKELVYFWWFLWFALQEWSVGQEPGHWFNIKMSSYQYRKSHYGDKMVVRSSYLHNGISW